MKRRCAMGLVAGLLVASCLPAHAIVLRYRPKINELSKRNITVEGSMQTSIEGAGQFTQREATASAEYVEKALSETAETTRVESRWIRGTLTTKANGESHTEELPPGRMVADIDRRKRLVEVVEADFGGGVDSWSLMGSGAETWTSFFAQFGQFPEGDIEVGDSWYEELKIPIAPASSEIKVTVESHLLALTTFQGRKCAKIRASFEGPISLDLSDFGASSEEAKGRLEATFHGDTLWYYDYENSVDVYQEASTRMEINLSVSEHEAPGGTITTEATLKMKMALDG
ncbi:MAG: hypothetical protein JSV79_14520 [Armatimonadota bacterium]|nr:MAG: hypothetical protein JSV79_14520 [Armatimonadota bacterium]